jgi:CBS domain-containing protein/sporulation protein YlmC with PRC-barrel domain
MDGTATVLREQKVYFLSEIIRGPVLYRGKKIGRLADLSIIETGKVPEVTHCLVTRPFGAPSLMVPWDRVKSIGPDGVYIEADNLQPLEGKPGDDVILLKDHVVDKKVLDTEEREVEVVYDVRLVMINGKLYVSDVDFGRYGLLRRMGLQNLAGYIYHQAFMMEARSQYSRRFKWVAKFLTWFANKLKDKRISWTYVQPLPTNISSFKGDVRLKVLKGKLSEMPAVDVADILEELDHEQRVMIFKELEPGHASDTLEEIDPNVQRSLVSSLNKDKVAQLVGEMTPAQAADILSVLPWSDVKAILELMNPDGAGKVRAILDQQEEKCVNYATTSVLKVSPDESVGQVQDGYPKLAKGKIVVMYLYVVGENDKLLGVVDIKELLLADDAAALKSVMVDHVVSLNPDSTLKEAFDMFQRYGFRALPVTDPQDKLLGAVTYRDVMNLKHRFVE